MELVNTIPGVHYDELIGGTAVSVLNKNVTLTGVDKDTTLQRGTLLALNSAGKYVVAAKAADAVPAASAVLAENVTQTDSGDIIATVYVRGIFNREKLIVQAGDTVDAHEEELRSAGIYLTSLHGIVSDAAAADEAKADEAKLSE